MSPNPTLFGALINTELKYSNLFAVLSLPNAIYMVYLDR